MLDVKTRWNSTYSMIEHAIRLKAGLTVTMQAMYDEIAAKARRSQTNDEHEQQFMQITEEHWKQFEDICLLLEPLNDATEILSGGNYPTLNMVVPAYNLLLDHLEKLAFPPLPSSTIYTESANMVDAAKSTFMKLHKYYDISSELCTISTVLDPRLKLQFYANDTSGDAEVPAEIRTYVNQFYARYAESSVPSSSIHRPKRSKFAEKMYQQTTGAIRQSELTTYLSEPVMENGEQFDILDYWRTNSSRFPNLSRMAWDYLAIPGTSTPSERAFSGGRPLVTDFRCSLKAETITACMLLKDWLKKE